MAASGSGRRCPGFRRVRRGYRAGTDDSSVDASVDMRHSRPEGAADAVVDANGTFSTSLEYIERARGHLHSFHQLMGHADLLLDDVVKGLRGKGHDELAERVESELVGRNVLFGRWTFQVVEEFDDGHHTTFTGLEERVCEETPGGRRHVFETELKQRRRTHGRSGHEATPRGSARTRPTARNQGPAARTTRVRNRRVSRCRPRGPSSASNRRRNAAAGSRSVYRAQHVTGASPAPLPNEMCTWS